MSEEQHRHKVSRFSSLSEDYFTRFYRSPEQNPQDGEMRIDSEWSISLPASPAEATVIMAAHLADFLSRIMGLSADVITGGESTNAIVLRESGGGEPGVTGSFTIDAQISRVEVVGHDVAGLRDGVVRLVDILGSRCGPLLPLGTSVYTPQLPLRVGALPRSGSLRELVFFGYNAMVAPPLELTRTSSVNGILQGLPRTGSSNDVDAVAEAAQRAGLYGVPVYLILSQFYLSKNAEVFAVHPDVQGAQVWGESGRVLCTEHHLVRQWMFETVAGYFRRIPQAVGAAVIVGGEGFYHCFTRSSAPLGHTTCSRCDEAGPARVVANLCTTLADAARSVCPEAVIFGWPYSAEHRWADDPSYSELFDLLGTGAGLLIDVEKDERVQTPHGVEKLLWDYSICLPGPGPKARTILAVGKRRGVPIHLRTEPELSFEQSKLPHMPALDRWADRGAGIARSGAPGAWVFSGAGASGFGSAAMEALKAAWWNSDVQQTDSVFLTQLAARITGEPIAAGHLRRAWRLVSEALDHSPEIPMYFEGPTFLGPAHPMCVDPEESLPEVFFGRPRYLLEVSPEDANRLTPLFFHSPQAREERLSILGLNIPPGDHYKFTRSYRAMAELLEHAAEEVDAASKLVPERAKLLFDAEASCVRWSYRTARSTANFYDSCRLREKAHREDGNTRDILREWLNILRNELENARASQPLLEQDSRLEFTQSELMDTAPFSQILATKIEILNAEIGRLESALVH